MSWQASGWAKKVKISPTDKKIKKPEKHLLLTMADDFVENRGYAEVSIKELAENTVASERQVRYTLRRLEEKGFIKTELGGPGRLSIYRFPAYQDGAEFAPKDKKEHGAKIAPSMGQELPGAKSSMGQSSVGDGISPPQTPPLLSSLSSKTDGEGEPPELPLEDLLKKSDWPQDDFWLYQFLAEQQFLSEPRDILLSNPIWWTSVGVATKGLSKEWLEIEFAKIAAYLIEHGEKKPKTAPGWLRLIRSWLVRENRWREEESVRTEKSRSAVGA